MKKEQFQLVVLACLTSPLFFCVSTLKAADSKEVADAKIKANIAAFEKGLPPIEQKAKQTLEALKKFEASTDPNVREAAQGARVRAEAALSIRDIIKNHPRHFYAGLSSSQLAQWSDGMDYFLRCAEEKKDPYAGMVDGPRSIRSKIDGHSVLYRLTLPKNYDPKKKYILHMYLHGANTLNHNAQWVNGKPDTTTRRAGKKEDRIIVRPCGRGNNSYTGMGEVSVLEVLDDVLKHYPIDEDRIYLGGGSMGGTGTFRTGTFHPDRFAAIYITTGFTGYRLDPENPRLNPKHEVENLLNLPICYFVAPSDKRTVESMKEHRLILQELEKKNPGSFKSIELNDPKGRHGKLNKPFMDQGWEWMEKHVRNPFPLRVLYKTSTLRYPGAYWVKINQRDDVAKPSMVDVIITSSKMIDAKLDNILRCQLDLTSPKLGLEKDVVLKINKAAPLKVESGKVVYLAKGPKGWEQTDKPFPAGLIKRPGLSGHVLDAFMEHPVMMVYGTKAGRDEKQGNAMIDLALEPLLSKKNLCILLRSPFERKADTAVSEDDIKAKNLVLFGRPETNEMIAKIADKLPIKFVKDGVSIKGKSFTDPKLGLIMIYPNPLNPDRYVLILPENYGEYTGLQIGDTYDLGDYQVICNPHKAWGGMKPTVKASGSFDTYWKLR